MTTNNKVLKQIIFIQRIFVDFQELGLSEQILKSIKEIGYKTPSQIQEQAIPHVLMGRDILGCAQTGTGKTASFMLPLIEILITGKSKSRMGPFSPPSLSAASVCI